MQNQPAGPNLPWQCIGVWALPVTRGEPERDSRRRDVLTGGRVSDMLTSQPNERAKGRKEEKEKAKERQGRLREKTHLARASDTDGAASSAYL